MLDFDVNFFEEETRRGKSGDSEYEFTIPAFMKHAWASELELLDYIDRICAENDIPYFADWGTLLGAVRHKGYIPWDDDLDLCMLRSDLERFCEVINNYDGIFVLNNYTSDEHGEHANRVTNNTVYRLDRDTYKDYHGFPFPVGIDIFTIDYVPRDKKLEEEQIETLRKISAIVNTKEWLSEHKYGDKGYVVQVSELNKALREIEETCNMKFSCDNPSEQEILILGEEIAGLYGDEDSDYLTQVACLGVGMDYYIPKDVYASSIRMPFENTTIPVPAGYDLLLRKKYGDEYMTPVNQGSGHDYPFYDRFIEAVYDDKLHNNPEKAREYIFDTSSRYYIRFRNKTTETAIDIPKDSFTEEEIEGSVVTSEEKHILASKCELLEEFKRLCSIMDIPYFAVNDTLVSAVQSGGYKNSDSAVHVAIRREDMSEFIKRTWKELDPWFNFETLYSNDSCEDMRLHIWSDSYKCDKGEFRERFHGYDKEMSLYVYMIDYATGDESKEEVRKTLVENLITTARSMPPFPPYSDEVLGIVDEWKRIADISVNTQTNLRREFFRQADIMGARVWEDNKSKVRITANLQDGIDSVYDKEIFDNTEELPFAFTTISVPAGYKDMVS